MKTRSQSKTSDFVESAKDDFNGLSDPEAETKTVCPIKFKHKQKEIFLANLGLVAVKT